MICCIQHILQQEHKINQIQPLILYLWIINSKLEPSYTSPLINDLSNHDAQFPTLNDICASKNKIPKKQRKRLINSDTLTKFPTLPEQETWESVYQKPYLYTNCLFNSFQSTFLNMFEASFPVKYKITNMKQNDCFTQGIKM